MANLGWLASRALGAGLAAAVATTLYSSAARAQISTLRLDRMEVPGAPDDGIAIFRPVTQQKSIFYAQLALGFSLRPLRTSTVTSDATTLSRSANAVIRYQLTQYASMGFQIADRFTLGLTYPIVWGQSGQNPDYAVSSLGGGPVGNPVQTTGPSSNDLRLDFRGVVARSVDRKAAFGAGLHIFIPMGSGAYSNFGSDGSVTAMPMISGEYSFKFITLVANTGFHFRPKNSMNDPANGNGLGVASEWRWAVGGFIPINEGKIRLGATIFGQTGVESDETAARVIGDTGFTKRNTPIQWLLDGRLKLGSSERWWVGAGAGGFILPGYGAPDLRVIALLGTQIPLADSDAVSPDRKQALHDKWRHEHAGDRDNDGIPDDIDACPDEPEDHQPPDPSDGCPAPKDRDGDGIPDQYDRCPDQPEDKDGIQDDDGCPEVDADNDGVPDTEDACPLKPGKPNKDPKLNGCPLIDINVEEGVWKPLQQVHFKTGSAEILPDSFPLLQEVVDLLKSHVEVKRMAVEGHTDDRGGMDLNMKLSQARASSVVAWLVQHGIAQTRLEAHGYGPTKPIDDNKTDAGRLANRRVEFKILEQEGDVKKKP
jgi:outer membrane protein OmpA-like peptidoglycan-associated protein